MAHTDDKKRARLNIITHLLSEIPYVPPKRKKITLPERIVRDDTQPGITQFTYIPTPF